MVQIHGEEQVSDMTNAPTSHACTHRPCRSDPKSLPVVTYDPRIDTNHSGVMASSNAKGSHANPPGRMSKGPLLSSPRNKMSAGIQFCPPPPRKLRVHLGHVPAAAILVFSPVFPACKRFWDLELTVARSAQWWPWRSPLWLSTGHSMKVVAKGKEGKAWSGFALTEQSKGG